MSATPPIDLKAMVCGLLPEIGRILRQSEANEVRLLLHKGVAPELTNVFGAGGEWSFCVHHQADCDLAVFRRGDKPGRNPLDLF
ncbi:MAG: hypothetical protein ACOCVM_05180 [Desulfovibrionaceae bacterium]